MGDPVGTLLRRKLTNRSHLEYQMKEYVSDPIPLPNDKRRRIAGDTSPTPLLLKERLSNKNMLFF